MLILSKPKITTNIAPILIQSHVTTVAGNNIMTSLHFEDESLEIILYR